MDEGMASDDGEAANFFGDREITARQALGPSSRIESPSRALIMTADIGRSALDNLPSPAPPAPPFHSQHVRRPRQRNIAPQEAGAPSQGRCAHGNQQSANDQCSRSYRARRDAVKLWTAFAGI